MNAEHIELLRRLEQFQLDSPESTFPFSAKLARENGWRATYTQRVLKEYKRFAFLSVAAGHPVSPSEDVDQAWHLHLTYTESYWRVFCPQVLQTSLHHQPTRGGAAETEKFDDWYARTLASYTEFFGEKPPGDIWPSPEDRRGKKHSFVRVDREQNWVIPRPRPRVFSKYAGVGALVAVGTCCTGAMLAETANVFDWSGSDFLRFYMVLYVVCFVGAMGLRRRLRTPGMEDGADRATDLDGYSVAYLNGGRTLAVNAAIVALVNQKALSVKRIGRTVTGLEPELEFAHPLEKKIYQAAPGPGGNSLANVRDSVSGPLTEIARSLQSDGLLLNRDTAEKARFIPLFVSLAPVMVGGVKVIIGLHRDRPVSYLIGLCALSLIVSLAVFVRRPLRSRKGDAVLAGLRSRHGGARRFDPIRMGGASGEIAMLLGLFGMATLAGTQFETLRAALIPPPNQSGWPGTSGGGCGSSGCSSGCSNSSCGGGGGGGGGCGGCSGGS